jgi:hypothetical protein
VAERRQAEQELNCYQLDAERKTMECRIAQSPLAQLRWAAVPSLAPGNYGERLPSSSG